jgi:adenylate cyclase
VRSGVLLGAAIAALGMVASFALLGGALEDDAELYWLFNARGPSTPPADVIIAAVDRASTRPAGLTAEAKIASPRRAHAAAVEKLHAAGAAVVAFDLQFDAAADDPDSDRVFASAMRAARNVVLVESIRRDIQPMPAMPGRAAGSIIIDTPMSPAEVLRDAARGYGAFQLPRTSRVDAYWAFPSRADNRASLPVLAFHLFALAAYDDLARLWQPGAGGADVPRLFARELAALPASEAIARVRTAIAADEAAARRARERLDRMAEADLPAPRKRLVRAMLALYSGEPVRYLNYYGPSRTIRTVPYDELIRSLGSDRADAQVRDKAVFIGYSGGTTSEQDRIRDDYVTVFTDPSGVQLSGVEIAATAFANILDDNEVRRLSPSSRAVLIVAWGLVLGFLCRVARPSWTAPAALLVSGLYLAIAAWIFTTGALALPIVVPVAIQMLLAVMVGTLMSYLEARREREAIKRTFGYYLPRNVVDELAQGIGPLTQDNHLVHGAVLFTDVEGYTGISEALQPDELARLMDRYFAEIFPPVKERGGTILDVAGDGMLAVWTSKSNEPGFRRAACLAMLEIGGRVARFNERAGAGPVLRTRMALHCGEVLLGSFGAGEHFEYRAVGDIVNAASRIDGLNKFLGTCQLVSSAMLEGIDDFASRPLGSFILAGKSKSLAVSELLGRRDDIASRQKELCSRFAMALAAYSQGRFAEARGAFEAILHDFPGDGPAAFYAERCAGLAGAAPHGDGIGAWDPTVRLETK